MDATTPPTAHELRRHAHALRDELSGVLIAFASRNADLPAQVLMAGIGELLVQFSVSQVGPGLTHRFLLDLQDAVRHTAPMID